MKEQLKTFASKISDYDLELLCAHPYKKLSDGRSVDVSKEICAALNEEGILSSAENDGIYIMDLNQAKEKLNNRIWLEDNVIPKVAKAKKVKIERNSCKHQVEAGTEDAKKKGIDYGIPGRIYCSLWKTQVENVVQIDGRCVPTKFLTQSVPESGTNQWGVDGKEEGKPLGNIKTIASKKKKILAIAEEEETTEVRLDAIEEFISKIEKKQPITEMFDALKNMNEAEKFELLKRKLIPDYFAGEALKGMADASEYVIPIIEEHLVSYDKIPSESFKSYINAIKEDEQKIISVLSDESMKGLSTYNEIVESYYDLIQNDAEKLENIIKSKILTEKDVDKFETKYLETIKEYEEKLFELLSNDIISQRIRPEYEKAYFSAIAEDEEKVKESLNTGVISESNIGEERVLLMLEKIYQNIQFKDF